MMTSFDAPNDAPTCAQELGLNYTVIEDCYNSWEGQTLLAAKGIQTHDLNPALYYVPWIMFDGMWRVEDMTGSEANLLNVLCEKLGNSTSKPAACEPIFELQF
jgi:hypothetical protein